MSFASMPLYTGDYLRDTRHLTPLKHGIYLLALMHCWDSQSPMPIDEQECAGICNCRSADEIEALRYVLARYFIKMDDGHYNKRMADEVVKFSRLSRTFSEAGLKSAEARRNKASAGKRAKAEGETAKIEGRLNLGSAEVKPRSVSPSPSPSLKDKRPSLLAQATASLTTSGQCPGSVDSKTRTVPDCPHQAILALWAEVLPAMPQHNPSMWSGARSDHLRARWRDTAVSKGWSTEADGLAYLRKLFAYVGGSAFLTGRARPPEGKPPFVIELAWLVMPQNWVKVHEGKYHTETV